MFHLISGLYDPPARRTIQQQPFNNSSSIIHTHMFSKNDSPEFRKADHPFRKMPTAVFRATQQYFVVTQRNSAGVHVFVKNIPWNAYGAVCFTKQESATCPDQNNANLKNLGSGSRDLPAVFRSS